MYTKMRLFLVAPLILGVFLILESPLAAAAARTPTFICVNQVKGTITVRGKCKKGEEKLTSANAASLGFVGAQGAMGPQGPKGDPGIQGPAGPSAFEPIPSGQVVYGIVGGDFQEHQAGGDWYGFSSLPAEAPLALDNAHVVVVETSVVSGKLQSSEMSEQSHCAGSASSPAPSPGYLCIYPTQAHNVGNIIAVAIPLGNSTSGFTMGWQTIATGDTFLRARWAYKAP